MLSRISVGGEVSNCKYHSSGHIYFSLKDGSGSLACVMFAGQRKGLAFAMKNGDRVVVTGSVDVYERDGKYQMYARKITLEGAGILYERFLALKEELEEMGMFAPEYKQPIPSFVQTVGVVTAPTGAVIQDIRNVTARRNPYVQIILYPAQVQGEGAAESIVEGIEALDQLGVDVIIVGRGGGSMEDLWAFNEEIVARAIFHCSTPIISAVGHETDVTIADYVADLRAPTPSAAAELAVFDYRQFKEQLSGAGELLRRGLFRKTEEASGRLEQYRLRLRLHDPKRQVNEKRQRLISAQDDLKRLMEKRLSEYRQRLALLSGRLEGCSPLKKLSQGFGFVTDEAGKRVDSVNKVMPGEKIEVRTADGRIDARVEAVFPYSRRDCHGK